MKFRKLILTLSFLGFLQGLLHAIVLDDFNSTSTINTSSVDTGASGSASNETGIDGNAVKFTYDLGTGGWAQMYKDYSAVDFRNENINSLRFRYKATGLAPNLEIKLTDNDAGTTTAKSDKFDLKFPLNTDNQWRTITVNFSSFTIFADGNKIFNLNEVSRIAFGVAATTNAVSGRGSGTVWIDKVELFRNASNIIDDFNDGGDPNLYGSISYVISAGGTGSREYTTVSGRQILQFAFDVSTNTSNAQYLVLALPTNNFQGYTHFSFKVRGNSGGEVLKVKLESGDKQNEVFVSTYLAGGITTSYQDVNIPVSSFTAISFSSLTAITFVAANNVGTTSGTIQIDDIGFIRENESSQAIRVFDECDDDYSRTGWDLSTHSDTSATVETISDSGVPGASSNNRVFKLNYTFNQSNLAYPDEIPYVIMERPFYLSIAPYSKLNFTYKGVGSSNNIELKLQDSDDTIWYRKFLGASSTGGEWKTATFPVDQLSFFSNGTDSELNMKKIKKLYFAISKSTGGSGSFSIDSFGTPESGEFATNNPSRLISTFKIINNPFSPNGDKIKDECFFVYSLGSQSKVNLRVYGLDGVERKIIFAGDQSSGEQSVSWDGTDSNSEKMENGIYLYRLEAEGVDNRKDLLVQVIAVLK